jgi:carbon monoxide dehydrogenase subunit G
MTTLHSEPVIIRKKASEIFHFLNDFNNFEMLMPNEVTNWQSTKESCSFVIKGMANLSLVMDNTIEFSQIVYASADKKPFDFSMIFDLNESDSKTNTHITFKADLNPMLKMMASKPLKNFLDLIAGKLKEVMEEN